MKRNKFRRRQIQKNGGYVNSLSPTAQVSKVLADVVKFPESYHLGNWSASARAELAPHINIQAKTLDPSTGILIDIDIPKLAFMAASPVFARHMEENPEATRMRFVHQDIDLEAIRSIAKWLNEICSQEQYENLDVPQDLEQTLKLRLTARALGMFQYVTEIIEGYIRGLSRRIPEPSELETVLAFTRDQPIDDPIMEVLENYTAWLCTYHKLQGGLDTQYARVLAGDKGKRFFFELSRLKK